jgi:DinB family protein
VTIVPDTKNWTWVIDRRCPECGFDGSAVSATEVPGRLRECTVQWQDVLALPTARQRPQPDVWSPLEYGCHVRDVCRIFDHRLQQMLTETDPAFANWDQDETAIADRYETQDPMTVTRELAASAAALAERFDLVSGAEWQRTGRRSDGASFTVDSFSRYFLHDIVHHLHDVAAV